MEKYRKVKKPQQRGEDHIVKVNKTTPILRYVRHISNMFESDQNTVVIKAMGLPANKAATLAEIVKYRVPNLHQINQIGNEDIEDIKLKQRIISLYSNPQRRVQTDYYSSVKQ